jgi:hypothetical protein
MHKTVKLRAKAPTSPTSPELYLGVAKHISVFNTLLQRGIANFEVHSRLP